jgi:hypothetical protein
MSYEITVDPKIEMLGVLEFLLDLPSHQESNPSISSQEKEYIHKIKHIFSPFQNHPALMFLQEMQEQGFKSEQAVRLLLYHSQIPYLFSQPVIQNQKHLEWVQLLRGWIEDTKFPSFFEKSKSFYKGLEEYVNLILSEIPLCDVIELFFGEKRHSYHIFVSPIKIGNYNVFLPSRGIAVVIGSPILESVDLYSRIIHEFSHLFIRPAVDINWTHFLKIEDNGKPPKKREAVYELIVQAVQGVIVPGSKQQYSLLTTLTEKIETEFRAKRHIYPTFASFIPQLAKIIREN